jgi:hypothetical protein
LPAPELHDLRMRMKELVCHMVSAVLLLRIKILTSC